MNPRLTPKQSELLVSLYESERSYMESEGFHARYPTQEVHRDELRTAKSLESKKFMGLRYVDNSPIEATLTESGRELGKIISEKLGARA
jgi:hypothetical protein